MRDILELALRSVAAEHSDRPMYLVFPARRISSRAGIDSSRGVSMLTLVAAYFIKGHVSSYWDQCDGDSKDQEQIQVFQLSLQYIP